MAPWTLLGSAIALTLSAAAVVVVLRSPGVVAPGGGGIRVLALLLIAWVAFMVLVTTFLAELIENPSGLAVVAGLAGIVIGGCSLTIARICRRAVAPREATGRSGDRDTTRAALKMAGTAFVAVCGVVALLLTVFIEGAP